MSCFQVSDRHLTAIIKGAIALGYIPKGTGWGTPLHVDLELWGCALASMNAASVEARYGARASEIMRDDGELFVFDRSAPTPSPVELAKLCACYAYQSCETEDWETSLVKHWVDGLEAYARKISNETIGHMATNAAYARAAWGL